jgi:RNA polymerase sigma-70 factor (ECF subfamily)
VPSGDPTRSSAPQSEATEGSPVPSGTRGAEERREELVRLFRSHDHELRRLALSFVRCHADAEDIVQRVFLSLLAERPTVPSLGIGYVARAVANASRDTLRRRMSQRRALEAAANLEPHPSSSPDEELCRKRAADLLLEAMASLPRGQLEAFQKTQVEGLSHQEVASELNVSTTTVTQQVYRARKRMREHLRLLGIERSSDI